MLTIVGDDELDIIELPNNMKINMAFGIVWNVSFGGNYSKLNQMETIVKDGTECEIIKVIDTKNEHKVILRAIVWL